MEEDEDVVDIEDDGPLHRKREADLVTELKISRDVDIHADLVGEMLGRLCSPIGEKSAMKTKEHLLCKQLFGLFSFLAVNEVHGTVSQVDMKLLYANANISFSRFYGGSLKLMAYWRDGLYAKLPGGDLPTCFDQYVKEEKEVRGRANWRSSKFLTGLDENGKDHAKFGMTVWTKGMVIVSSKTYMIFSFKQGMKRKGY